MSDSNLRDNELSVGFSLLKGMGGVPPLGPPPPTTKFLFPPTKSQFPHPTKQQFSSYNTIKTAFLAVVVALAPFLF